MSIALPTIHLNGTSPEMLRDDYKKVYWSVSQAIEALEKAEFNPRDFYLQGEKEWQTAKREREEIFKKLRDVKEYAMAWYIHADDTILTKP
jgi:hypothetical protein